MMRKFFSFAIVTAITCACAGFPFSDMIDDSAKYVTENHKDSFKKLKLESEDIHYLSLGDTTKNLVILIHGSPGSWKSFAHFFKDERLLKNFELVAFDRFGYGQNRPGEPFGSLDEQIKIPKLIIEKIRGDRKVIVVGHSYGGPVAVKLAMKYPELVDGLVLAAASVDPELEETKWYQHLAKLWGIRSLIPDDLDVCNREILQLKKELQEMDGNYSLITQPTYVLQGDIDDLVPVGNADYLRKKINPKNISIQIIQGGNHFIPWGYSKELIDAIFNVDALLAKREK
jgi:pimeloyl-ACP methyl ester carboxylesterase